MEIDRLSEASEGDLSFDYFIHHRPARIFPPNLLLNILSRIADNARPL